MLLTLSPTLIPGFPLDYVAGAVDEIIRLTRWQPMLVQLVGSLLVDWLDSPTRRQQRDWLTATMNDVAHAAREILRIDPAGAVPVG